MTVSNRQQIVLNKVVTDVSGSGYTHESLAVTKTATMTNGSLLVAAGTEAALLDAANVVYVIDCPEIDQIATGEAFTVSVAKGHVVLNKAALTYSDGALADETALTALIAADCQFAEVKEI